ncbi:hypothetical protein B0H14DRAFT_2616527 [Mycena olivaceomarginata]|nr:hypothetical protein B0H14DRAFT_2616527 [Mycena olivaceomarginata]
MKSGNDLSNCIRFGIGVYQYQNKLTGTSIPHLLATWIVLWGRGAQDVYFTKLPKHAASMKGRVLGLELWIDRHPRRGTSSKKRKPASVQVSKENTNPAKRPRNQFVAKRLCEIGPGSNQDEVSMAENILNLKYFDITQCSLVQEVIIEGGAPSSASGVVREIFETEPMATRKVV